jgi:hypothetical protein
LSKRNCSAEGLFDEKSGKTLLAMRLQNSGANDYILKTDEVENLLLLMRVSEKREIDLGDSFTQSIYKGDERADLNLICREDLLGSDLSIHGDKVDESELTTFLPARPWNELDVNQFFNLNSNATKAQMHMLLMKEKKYLSKNKDNPNVYLKCSKDKKTLDIHATVKDWAYHFRIGKEKFAGTFTISDIEDTDDWTDFNDWSNRYQFNTSTKNLWNYEVVDKEQGFRIVISLDPLNKPLVKIRFLEVPEIEKLRHGHWFQDGLPPLEYLESLWYIND